MFRMYTEEDLNIISHKLWNESIKNYRKKTKKFRTRLRKMCDDAMRYREQHSKEVATISTVLIKNIDKWLDCDDIEINNYDHNILYFACLTHDIRKYNKKHSEKGSNWLRNNMNIIDEETIEDICMLVEYHNNNKPINEKLSEKDKILILVIRLSDKISKVNEKESEQSMIKVIKDVCENSEECIPKKYKKHKKQLKKLSNNIYLAINNSEDQDCLYSEGTLSEYI